MDIKFSLGQTVATQGIMGLLTEEEIVTLLNRHAAGDWGDLDEEDKELNKDALINGERLFSSYDTQKGKVWVITEYDRSVTTVLSPDEY